MGLKIKKDSTTGKIDVNFKFIELSPGLIFNILAILVSWATNKSIGWVIIHYLFGALYLIYWAITGDNATEEGVKEIINYYKNLFN